jgi:hypothetical protein
MFPELDLEPLIQPERLSTLVRRSRHNIDASAALIAAATAQVCEARRIRRPPLAGGNDRRDAPANVWGPRMLRTWTKLNAGALPSRGARHRWVGPGRGGRCSGCGDPIAPRDTAVELDFSDALLLQFHAGCFKTWESFGGRLRR